MPDVDAILLVSFGGPDGPDDVMPFLENVTRGRGIPRRRLTEVASHYDTFGGISPINDQCRRIQGQLQDALLEAGHDLPVYWGNRNWRPFLSSTVAQMADDGVGHALAIATSAYSSYSGCRQYLDDIELARARFGEGAPLIDKVRAYHDHPGFVNGFVKAAEQARKLVGDDASDTPIIFTAHSLPTAMAASCDYESQLGETARLVAEGLRHTPPWTLAWQSRSGPPSSPWLGPDINDELRRLATTGALCVVIVPIGFVSDHMEVVWDLDTEAAATAEQLGIRAVRAATPGTEPTPEFISMYVDLIEERLQPGHQRASLSTLGARPDTCPPHCCPPSAQFR